MGRAHAERSTDAPEQTPAAPAVRLAAPADRAPLTPADAIALQRAAGNAAVARLALARRSPAEQDKAERAELGSLQAAAKAGLAKGGSRWGKAHMVMWRLVSQCFPGYAGRLSASRYEASAKGIRVDVQGKGDAAHGTLVAGDDFLQLVAAGRTAQLVKALDEGLRRLGREVPPDGSVDYVFLMGTDSGRNRFYDEAEEYFAKHVPGATIVKDVRSLKGIVERVQAADDPVANLYIVSHAHPDGTLQFSLDDLDKTPGQLQYDELLEGMSRLPKVNRRQIGAWTHVHIKGCALGRSAPMLSKVRTAFGGETRLTAPTHAQYYSGGEEAMAGPFIELPGRSKLTTKQALNEIKQRPEYAFVTAAQWKSMAGGMRRFDHDEGDDVYHSPFPAPGRELELLRSQVRPERGERWAFVTSQVSGDEVIFSFRETVSGKTADINCERPPSDQEAEARIRARSSRPDIAEFKVRHIRSGLDLRIRVDAAWTEFTLYHKPLREARGKLFAPPEEKGTWFGEVRDPVR
jgi:hypothetical protein